MVHTYVYLMFASVCGYLLLAILASYLASYCWSKFGRRLRLRGTRLGMKHAMYIDIDIVNVYITIIIIFVLYNIIIIIVECVVLIYYYIMLLLSLY